MTLPDSLAGRVAVVTGASRGIGAALARDFAAHGLALGLCSRSTPVLESGPGVVAAQLDVSDEAAVNAFAERVVAELGRIDLWVNNAGVLEPIAPLRDISAAAFRRHMEINLMGVVHGTHAFLRHVRGREGEGVLINISSGAAWQGYAGWAPYCAGKAGVDRLTEAVQLEEADAGLRAYAVAPGVVDTAMQELIRSCSPEQFPMVERFRTMKTEGSFNSTKFVCRHLLSIAFDEENRPQDVVVRLPMEGEAPG